MFQEYLRKTLEPDNYFKQFRAAKLRDVNNWHCYFYFYFFVKEKGFLAFLVCKKLIKLLTYSYSYYCTNIASYWVFVRGRSQAQDYFEEPLEPKAVISFMPYENLR